MKLDFPRLFLIGYRGTGKTTVGRLLAERLGWSFVDADEELERRCGKTIRALFTDEGEPAFRDKEDEVLLSLCQRERHVIATGGGVILREMNREHLRRNGKVVWLTANASTIAQRLRNDATTTTRRPDLGVGGTEEINETLRIREALYARTSDMTVSTDGLTPETVTDVILTQLKAG